MTAADKWNDLVTMSKRENKDGDYDAILYASSVIERAGDVDTLTDKLFANGYPVTLGRCRVISKYFSRWLMGGK